MPIDRAFSVRGTGTVVTGTVWSGTLARDASVRVLPAGHTARVRTLQSHGAVVAAIGPGSRAAVALVGVDLDAVGARGGARDRPVVATHHDAPRRRGACSPTRPCSALARACGSTSGRWSSARGSSPSAASSRPATPAPYAWCSTDRS
jgi:hypothetical protein